MVKVKNVFGDELSGTVAKTGVYSKWKGRAYRRKWVKPANPNTPAQQEVRGNFATGAAKYKSFNAYQKQAYDPLAAGLVMSGYNLFLSRWQKMTDAEREAYVEPQTGFKQIGLGDYSDANDISIVTNQKEYSAGTLPIVIGKSTFTKSTGDLDPVGIVDVQRGRIDMLKSLSGTLKINYMSGGRVVTAEELGTNPSTGDIFYTEYFPIVYKSSKLVLGTTDQHTMEVDIVNRKFYVTYPDTFSSGGSISYRNYTPKPDAKLEIVKAGSNFITHRGYSDASGIIRLAQTIEDGNRDVTYEAAGVVKIIKANVSAIDSAKDEYIAMTAV